MPKKISIFIIILIVLLSLLGLGRQISTALTSGSRLDNEVEQVGKLQEENKKLKNRLSEVQKYSFLESFARDKLNFAKPNETVVIIAPELLAKALALNEPPKEVKLPNYQGWLRLFLH